MPTIPEALASFAFAGVAPSSVRTLRPTGSADVVAICVRNGEALCAFGATVAQALERLLTAAHLAAYGERQQRRAS